MRITPDSTITLYQNVDIDNDEQLVFSSRANQTAYFQSKIHPNGAYTPCTVVRKTGAIRVEKSGSVVSACNYLSFVNPSFDNKVIYARIIDYEYINNECVEISYIIDYWQTWMFDVTFQNSFIEREHLSQADFTKAETNPYDRTIYEFQTSENLPIGPDTEKPYYEIGTGVQNEDGAFLGERVATQYSLDNKIGALVIFSDINLDELDSNPQAPNKSQMLVNALRQITREANTSTRKTNLGAFRLTSTTGSYLTTKYPSFADCFTSPDANYISTGGKWDVGPSGHVTPFATNRIVAPCNYAYIDDLSMWSSLLDSLLDFFTGNAALDSVLGIYPVPQGLMLMSGVTDSSGTPLPFVVQMATAASQNVENRKLDLYPYSYYRLTAPNGDEKELHIEKFRGAQLNNQQPTIGVSLDIVEKPNLLIAPINYKAAGMAPNNPSTNMNCTEALVFSQFPTLPYDIDAFKSQMAAVANSIIGNNTVEYTNDLQYRSELLNDKTITSGASALGNTALAGVGMATGQGTRGNFVPAVTGTRALMLNEMYARPALENEAMQADAAYRVSYGGANEESNAIYANYKYTKPAYAAKMYNAINGDGVLNANRNAFFDILFMRVSLNPLIMAQYDLYFKQFGYNSGRCGIPRVVNYVNGSTTTTDIPHWTTINNKLTTFIKTRDCKVIHSMLPVAGYIKAMFDSGVRMIKGDLT